MRSLSNKQQKEHLKLLYPDVENIESTKITGLYWYAIKNNVLLYFNNTELIAIGIGTERFVFAGICVSVWNTNNLLKNLFPSYTKITTQEKKKELLDKVKTILK